MTPTELKQARQLLGLNIKQMAEALQTPYRTYQDWEGGHRRIPGITEIAVDGLTRRGGFQTRPGKGGSMYIVINIGCICCRVSSKIVGVFADKGKAEDLAESLGKTHSFRGGGENEFVVMEIPPPEVVDAEYLAPPVD